MAIYDSNTHGFDWALDGLGDGPNEIDIRQEISDLIDARGSYVAVRRRTDQRCPYWSAEKGECTQECPYCNGLGWTYLDYFFMAR